MNTRSLCVVGLCLVACGDNDGEPRVDVSSDAATRMDAQTVPPADAALDATTSHADAALASDGSAVDAALLYDASVAPHVCAPPTQVVTGQLPYCGGKDQHLPVADSTMPSSVALAHPLTPGKRVAVSFRTDVEPTAGTVEIWGARGECGVAEELLWWAPKTATLCAEFVASQAYTHLIVVHREVGVLTFQFDGTTSSLQICEEGMCAGGADGTGRSTPSDALDPTIGTYRPYSAIGAAVYDYSFLNYAHMTLQMKVANVRPANMPLDIGNGIFRLGPHDKFGDAWYCVGNGSTITFHDQFAREADLHLRNITKLPACTAGTDTATLTRQASNGGVTSSSSKLGYPTGYTDGRCVYDTCNFSFGNRFLSLKEPSTVAESASPAAFTEAAWIVMNDDRTPPTWFCTTTGTLTYNPSATTSGTFKNLRSATCPGTPIADNQVDLVFE